MESWALLCEWSSGGLKVPSIGYRRAGQEGLQPRGEQWVGELEWSQLAILPPTPIPGRMRTFIPAAPTGSKPGDKWEPKMSVGLVDIRTEQGGNRDCVSHGSAVDSGRGSQHPEVR